MALAGVELEALVFETDALTTRPEKFNSLLLFSKTNGNLKWYIYLKKTSQYLFIEIKFCLWIG